METGEQSYVTNLLKISELLSQHMIIFYLLYKYRLIKAYLKIYNELFASYLIFFFIF